MPASEVEVVVRSPKNMAATKIVAVHFNKMRRQNDVTLAATIVREDLLASRRLQMLLLF